jgi:predicted TIM-barrel fold metal-dependent hydrolase
MKKKKSTIISLLLIGTLLTGFTPAEASANAVNSTYKMVDSHLHYLDFLQGSDGFQKLMDQMDAANVSHAVVFGMAMAKQWDEHAPNQPTYYLSNDSRAYYFTATDYMMMQDYMEQPDEIRNRLFPFVCGVNPNDKYAAAHLRKVLEDYPGQFYGIGELMSRHDDLTALTYGEPPRADHPAFLEIYDLADEFDIPVLIHHNVSGSYMDDPIYLEEMKNALAYNRDTDIIWAHVGISRRVEISNLLEITDEMLKNNENLYYDISWVVYDDYINKDAESIQAWAKLIEKYPDRFMIGTDVVGHWQNYTKEVTKYYTLLDELKPATAQKLCAGNILDLINVEVK